jgi:hypothetical protein
MNKTIPTAKSPPKLSISEGLIEVAAPVLEAEAAVEVEDEPEDELEVPEPATWPAVPLAVVPPGRLTVAFAARDWKLARVRVALAVGLL